MEPRLACLAEYMCGAGFILSQHTASRKTAKVDAMVAKMDKHGRGYAPALHADQSWMPSPFPEHNLFLTACSKATASHCIRTCTSSHSPSITHFSKSKADLKKAKVHIGIVKKKKGKNKSKRKSKSNKKGEKHKVKPK